MTLDIGSSSVRTLLFDAHARRIEGFGAQQKYDVDALADGGVEIDPETLVTLCMKVLAETQHQIGKARPAAVGFSCFWHSFLCADAKGHALSPIFHLLDTRSASQAEALRRELNVREVHKRTGCVVHTSYWPSKLKWLKETRPALLAKTAHLWSPGEYIFARLFGKPSTSVSMSSATGLWDHVKNDWDQPMLDYLRLHPEWLAPASTMDEPREHLRSDLAALWPSFEGIPWYPAYGDGACNNIGSGCVSPNRFALMVGTTGAMRAVFEQDQVEVPEGLWCYRVDRQRYILGGALSNGGKVYEWMTETLQLPKPEEIESQLADRQPAQHGISILPFFAGERAPRWRTDARATFHGLDLHTGPMDLLHAGLESVALRFKLLYNFMRCQLDEPAEVIASGGILHSPAWTQMMADALGRPIMASGEPEASSRGAAMMVLERVGLIQSLQDCPAELGRIFQPRLPLEPLYAAQLDKMDKLYFALYPEQS